MTIDQIALWSSAAEAFDTRYQQVKAEHHNLATPCNDFDVATLVDHVIGNQIGIGQIFGSTAKEGASWEEARMAMKTAITTPGSLEGSLDHPFFGEITKAQMLIVATNDMLIHTWDLSRAIGVDEILPEQNLQPAIDGIEAFPAHARSAAFAPPLDSNNSASLQDKMLAVAGRQA